MTTLARIRSKVRAVTGSPSTSQLSDAAIDDAVNTFYLYDLPEHLRLIKLKGFYTFQTFPGQDVYSFPETFYSLMPLVYVDGYGAGYHQDPAAFYSIWPQQAFIQQISTGDGTIGPYTGTISGTPFLANQVLISDGVENFTDDGAGVLTGSAGGTGTVNYTTGAFSVTFATAVVSGTAINSHTVMYQPSRPLDVLFFENQLTLRPVPDQAYTVKIEAFRKPTALLSSSGAPEIAQWWQALAYGAAMKIFSDRGDFESMGNYQPLLEEQLLFVQRTSLVQLANQRSQTPYSGAPNAGYDFFNPLFR